MKMILNSIWVVLFTQAHDVKQYHPEMIPYFNTLFMFSLISGPITAFLQIALHSIPFFADPLSSVQCLMIEAVGDSLAIIVWASFGGTAPHVLSITRIGCPVSDFNSTDILLANNSTTSSTTMPILTSSMIAPTSTTIFNGTMGINGTYANGNGTMTVITNDPVCKDNPYLWMNIAALTGTMACLYFLSLFQDYFSFMKGTYWALEEYEEREHAATSSTLRQLNKFSHRLQRGEMASVSVSSMSRSGSRSNLKSLSGGGNAGGAIKGGLGGLQGVVAGKAATAIISKQELGGNMKKSASNGSISSFTSNQQSLLMPRVDVNHPELKGKLGKSQGSLSRVGSHNNVASLKAASGDNINSSSSRVRSGSAASLLSKSGSSKLYK